MKRPINGFGLDPKGDWFATLDCGHRQHVRHRPPFCNRPWVVTEAGRNDRLGMPLDCVRCDRVELPEGFVAYRKTPVYTEHSIPAALTGYHATKAGVWTRIFVLGGRLRVVIAALDMDTVLDGAEPGIVPPALRHRLEPRGRLRFYLEWLRAPGTKV